MLSCSPESITMLLVFSPRFLYHPGTTLLLVGQGFCLGLPGTLTQSVPPGLRTKADALCVGLTRVAQKGSLSICRCLLID